MAKKTESISTLIKKHKIEMISFKMCDLLGRWSHFTIPASRWDEKMLKEGLAFDASSLIGFQSIENSDLLIIPDESSTFVDPIMKMPTLSVSCFVANPFSKEKYWLDTRSIAKNMEEYLIKSKIADTAYFGSELEFFIFDKVKFATRDNESFLRVDSFEADWDTPYDNPNIGMVSRKQEGYFRPAPFDQNIEMRYALCKLIEKVGMTIERDTHERATAGSAEINIKYDSLLKSADNLNTLKYLIRNKASSGGKSVTFMPKPLFEHNGSGLHTHFSLWKNGKNLFAGKRDNYCNLSDAALHFIAGVLKHTPAIMAFSSPTTNSYKRLVPGYEAPTAIAFGSRNRSTVIRIPSYPDTNESRRLEFRVPDPSANPYLFYSAMILAGIDGMDRKLDPNKLGYGPFEENAYTVEERGEKLLFTPGSLSEVLNELEKDNEFLTKSEVFSKNFVEHWIDFKRKEIKNVNIYPTPSEFVNYFDC